jgi:DNA-binding winged helix-turn-helix (wHTH) protein
MALAFFDHVLDTERRQLIVGGQAATISTKAFDLLCLLANARPAVVSKKALILALWPDAHVTDNSLAVLVAELRAAFGETGRDPRVIRTVHRVGYAFAAPVKSAEAIGPVRFVLVGGERPWPLADGECLVGRDSDAGWVVAGPSVSRRHARLVVMADGVEVHDLASKNGTFVDECRVVAPVVARDGATLRFGTVPFTLRAATITAETETSTERAV